MALIISCRRLTNIRAGMSKSSRIYILHSFCNEFQWSKAKFLSSSYFRIQMPFLFYFIFFHLDMSNLIELDLEPDYLGILITPSLHLGKIIYTLLRNLKSSSNVFFVFHRFLLAFVMLKHFML